MTGRAARTVAAIALAAVIAIGCSGDADEVSRATDTPTAAPTAEPTAAPTAEPTTEPTTEPTATAEPTPEPTPTPERERPDDAVTIGEVLERGTSGLVTVEGFIIVDDGVVRLCTALAESFPPQCGGPSAIVEGLDLDTIDDLQTQGTTSWTDEPQYLTALLIEGRLEVVVIVPE